MSPPEVRPAAAFTGESERPGSSREPSLHLLTQATESGYVTFPCAARGRLHIQGGGNFTFKERATSPSRGRRFHLKGTATSPSRGRRLLLQGAATSPSGGRRLHLQGDGDFTFKGAATSLSGGRRLHLQGDGDFTFKGTATSPQEDGDFSLKETVTSPSKGRRLHLQGDGDFTFKGAATSPSGGRRLHLQGAADFSCAWFGLRFKVSGRTWIGPLHLLLRGQRVALTFKGGQRTPSPSGATRGSPSPSRPTRAPSPRGQGTAVCGRDWSFPCAARSRLHLQRGGGRQPHLVQAPTLGYSDFQILIYDPKNLFLLPYGYQRDAEFCTDLKSVEKI
jgi:hypothetical protein